MTVVPPVPKFSLLFHNNYTRGAARMHPACSAFVQRRTFTTTPPRCVSIYVGTSFLLSLPDGGLLIGLLATFAGSDSQPVLSPSLCV